MMEVRVVPESLRDEPSVWRLITLLARVKYTERPMRWEIRRNAVGLGFCAVFTVKDANSDRQIEVFSPVNRIEGEDEYLLGLCRTALIDFAQHEVDEHLYVDGEKKYDPHRGPWYDPRRKV